MRLEHTLVGPCVHLANCQRCYCLLYRVEIRMEIYMRVMSLKSMIYGSGGGVLWSSIQLRCHPFFVRVVVVDIKLALSRVLV